MHLGSDETSPFAVCEEELEGGRVKPIVVILENQISYFADAEGFQALLDSVDLRQYWYDVLTAVISSFNEDYPMKSLSHWTGMDQDFKNLLIGLTNFNPAKRLTAKEALEHKWFADVD